MRTIVSAIFIFLFTGSVFAAQYKLCSPTRLEGGEILFLKNSDIGFCWQELKKDKISMTSIARKGSSYRFTYIFGDSSLKHDFDPIFNVQIKEVNVDKSPSPNKVELYREKFATHCNGKRREFHVNKEFGRKEEDAAAFNAFHKGPGRNPDRNLADFHIAFLNSKKECIRTDSAELTKDFALDPSDVVQKTTRMAGLIENLFGVQPAMAAAGPYKRISVEIENGEFVNTLFAGSFSVPFGKRHFIIVKDLSTYPGENGGRRRDPISFAITD